MEITKIEKAGRKSRLYLNDAPAFCLYPSEIRKSGLKEGSQMEEADLEKICALSPDLIEWRIDYYCHLDDNDFLTKTVCEMHEITGDIPILLTFRALSEGGYKEYPDTLRFWSGPFWLRSHSPSHGPQLL